MEPEKGRAQIMHRCPTRQHQQQAQTPRVQTQEIKPGKPPRVVPSKVPVDTPEKRKPGRPPSVTPSEVHK